MTQIAAVAPKKVASMAKTRRRIFDVTQSTIQIGMTVFVVAIVSAPKPMQNSA